MNKGSLFGGGLILLIFVGGLYYTGLESKQEAQTVKPGMAAGYTGANAANVVALNMARVSYFQAKEKAPEKAEDMVPEFIASIPAEAFSKSNTVVKKYDGSGGWVMDEEKGFLPNYPQTTDAPGK
ncbi:MAG TPA: hypothetical protein VK786_07500 [bacterium]|jgi:hypothetical protein|nr:hypothetical protein [bacterium]